MVAHLVVAQHTVLPQLLGGGVVMGASQQGVATEVVQTRVADMRPVGVTVLHQTQHASSARHEVGGALGVIVDGVVRLHDAEREKRRRLGDAWVLHCLERAQYRLYEQFGCDLAAAVAAETVGQDHQHGVVTLGVRHPVPDWSGANRAGFGRRAGIS